MVAQEKSEIIYTGQDEHDVFKYIVADRGTEPLPLELSLKLANHSPTGFSWGYLGSGPAQLAIALLLDATGDPEIAQSKAYDFKVDFVAGWGETWVIFRSDIINWLKGKEG